MTARCRLADLERETRHRQDASPGIRYVTVVNPDDGTETVVLRLANGAPESGTVIYIPHNGRESIPDEMREP